MYSVLCWVKCGVPIIILKEVGYLHQLAMLEKDFKQLHLGFGVTKENGQELNGAMLCLDREEREQD